MKKLLLLLLFIPLVSFGQNNLGLLTGYKYVYVNDLSYKSGRKDIYGLAGQTRKVFHSLGFSLISVNTKYSGNPCEILRIYVNHSSRSKVDLEARNCKNQIVYKTSGHAANWNNNYQDNFNRSLKIILNQISELDYYYNKGLTPKLDISISKYEGNLFDVNNEKSVRDYFQKNNQDFIEGIWNYVDNTGNTEYKLLIIKDGYHYNTYVLQSNTWWSPGELKATIEPAAVNTVLSINWTMGNKQTVNKTIGKLEPGVISFSINNDETILYKVFPKLDSSIKSNKKSVSNDWAGNGSGIIISKSGHIITNHHVIEDANDIEVEFILNGKIQKFNAEIVQVDKTNDLAILKIFDMNFDGVEELPYNFKTRSSDVGTKIYAFGYPMALSIMGKEIKVTDGMISSKTGFDGNITTYQITAPIQGGNSGGPLFDEKGNLIGINSSGLRKDVADNVAYSIKTSYVLNLIDILPKSIELPSNTKLESLPLTEQIKEISKYVVLIKVK
jgi:S1-C subfamily serine protease